MSIKNRVNRKLRAANSLLMALTAIPVAISSVYLYFAPYDAAYRNIIDNLHILLGFVLIGSFVLHIPMNWRPLKSYLKSKTKSLLRPRAEGMAALTIFILLMLGGIAYPVYSDLNTAPLKAPAVTASSQVDATSAADAGINAPAAATEVASAPTGTKITYVPADISSCGNCDLIVETGGCHSGQVFNLKGTIYFGSASGVAFVQKVVDTATAANAEAASAETTNEPFNEAIPEGIDPAIATQPADAQLALVPESSGDGGGGRHGGRN